MTFFPINIDAPTSSFLVEAKEVGDVQPLFNHYPSLSSFLPPFKHGLPPFKRGVTRPIPRPSTFLLVKDIGRPERLL